MAMLTAVAPERSTFIAPVTLSGTQTIRKSVYALTDQEVQNYRLAVYRIAQISALGAQDNRGYQYVAGIHGQPGRYCKHHVPAFAIWHRPFMQGYEQRLQDFVPEVFVPYWDWTTRRAEQEGIPSIFTHATWDNPDTGKTEPNPLLSQPKTLIGGGATSRDPRPSSDLVPLRDLIHSALLAPDYDSFAADLENPHDQLHVWAGGDLSVIAFAAYDPLFWSHHCFVEYVLCQWQDAHTEATAPVIDPRDFAPFSITIDDVWNYRKLGYSYLPDNASDLQVTGLPVGPGAATANQLRSGVAVANFPLYAIDLAFNRAELRFDGLTPPEDSFAVRVFAGVDKASANTPTNQNPHYLGTRYFFGHGECGGAPGHCDPIPRDIYDLRPHHHYAPLQVRLDVTRRLRSLIQNKPADAPPNGDAPVTLVVIDRDGNEISESELHFEGLSVVVR
jgi:tyrosinase